MIIYTGKVKTQMGDYQGREVICEVCGQSVGIIDSLELSHLLRHSLPIVCFDCEGSPAEEVPQHLVMDADLYYIGLWKEANDYDLWAIAWVKTELTRRALDVLQGPSGPFYPIRWTRNPRVLIGG